MVDHTSHPCYLLSTWGVFHTEFFYHEQKNDQFAKKSVFSDFDALPFFLVENILVYESSGAGKCP